MESDGVCSLCYEQLSIENRGVQCLKCYRRFHVSCSKVEGKLTRKTKWLCPQCSESDRILNLLNNQQSEISKLVELTTKVEVLSNELATLKQSIPDIIKTEVKSVLSANFLDENTINEVIDPIRYQIDCTLPTVN